MEDKEQTDSASRALLATSAGKSDAAPACTCVILDHRGDDAIEYCALHAAAPDLLKELRQARTDVKNLLAILDGHLTLTDETLGDEDAAICDQMLVVYDNDSVAIAKAEGRDA